MCGILAQYNKKSPVNTNAFVDALALLTHRGPDEYDHILLNNGYLAFGHTRLSIIGLNNGKQPISNQENSLFTVVNGEFYDYKRIRNDFALQGYKFKTHSDSEIIIPLYKKYKYEAFNKLNGEFAGIIYDSIDNTLVIFRDRHGVKPLYFKNCSENFIVSSEVKSILNIEKTAPEWNVDYLKQYFSFIHSQDNTVYKDIYHVKPGHYMVFNLTTHTLTEHKYWQIDYNRKNYLDSSFDDLAKQYEVEFVDAVSRRLVADVPVATYLSGGIDSSACYGVASTIVGKGVDAFTISFDNPNYDELKQAQALVNQYGGQQHVLNVDERLLCDHFDRHLWYLEKPNINPHSVAKYLLSNVVREAGFKVVITGEGADEYNAGYIPSVLDAIKYEHASTSVLSEDLINISSGAMVNMGSKELSFAKKVYGFSPSWFENAAVSNNVFNELYRAQFSINDPMDDMHRWLKERYRPEMKDWDTLNTSLYLTGQVTFAYVLSVLGDRTEMAHNVEARLPFLDHHLLEFLAKIPPKYKANMQSDKLILREAVKKYVTPKHLKTAKHPYLAPPLVKKNSLFATKMHDVFSSVCFKHSGLFDQKKVLNLLSLLTKSEKPNPEIEKRLFKILSFATLHKTFGFKEL